MLVMYFYWKVCKWCGWSWLNLLYTQFICAFGFAEIRMKTFSLWLAVVGNVNVNQILLYPYTYLHMFCTSVKNTKLSTAQITYNLIPKPSMPTKLLSLKNCGFSTQKMILEITHYFLQSAYRALKSIQLHINFTFYELWICVLNNTFVKIM